MRFILLLLLIAVGVVQSAEYEVDRHPETGRVRGIRRNNSDGSTTSIPIDKDNSDFQRFLLWSKTNPIDTNDATPSPRKIEKPLTEEELKKLREMLNK